MQSQSRIKKTKIPMKKPYAHKTVLQIQGANRHKKSKTSTTELNDGRRKQIGKQIKLTDADLVVGKFFPVNLYEIWGVCEKVQ